MLGKIVLILLFAQGATNAANGVIRGQILTPSVRASDRVQVIVQRNDGPIVARVYSDSSLHADSEYSYESVRTCEVDI